VNAAVFPVALGLVAYTLKEKEDAGKKANFVMVSFFAPVSTAHKTMSPSVVPKFVSPVSTLHVLAVNA
jgi:hypothetical protein